MNGVNIAGRPTKQLAISAVIANTGVLEPGVYDCFCDVDVRIAVNRATPIPALSVTNGYKIFAGNVIPVQVSLDAAIYVIAAGAGTFEYTRVNG